MAGFVTPLTDDANQVTLTFTLPAEVSWRAVFLGVLDALAHEGNWQQVLEDSVTPAEAAETFRDAIENVVIEDV